MKKKIVIGSRGSILALAQSEIVKQQLEKNFPEYEFEIKKIVTSGDKDLVSNWNNSDKSLKSFFTKEIEVELLNETIDLAVHSMKDMPSISPEGLICGAIPDREDQRDVLISKNGKTLMELPKGAIVGTSSLRRTMNIKSLRPDLQIKQLRGNIHTRLNKLKTEDYEKYDYIIDMEKANIINIQRIVGRDVDNKVYRLLDFSNNPRDIADPWYTGNFEITFNDIVEGCNGFLEYLKSNGRISSEE